MVDGLLSVINIENSISIKDFSEPSWRLRQFSLDSVKRSITSIEVNYTISFIKKKKVSRKVYIEDNIIKIHDIGSDGINLNLAEYDYNIIVYKGGDVEEYRGQHSEDGNNVIENNRIYIASIKGETFIGIKI